VKVAKITQDIAPSVPTRRRQRRGNLVAVAAQVFDHAAEVVTANTVFEKANAALGLEFGVTLLAKQRRVTKLSRDRPL
jgi:hypothetical protein